MINLERIASTCLQRSRYEITTGDAPVTSDFSPFFLLKDKNDTGAGEKTSRHGSGMASLFFAAHATCCTHLPSFFSVFFAL